MQNSFSAPDARGAANIVFLCWARVFGLPLLSVPRGVFFKRKIGFLMINLLPPAFYCFSLRWIHLVASEIISVGKPNKFRLARHTRVEENGVVTHTHSLDFCQLRATHPMVF